MPKTRMELGTVVHVAWRPLIQVPQESYIRTKQALKGDRLAKSRQDNRNES